MVYQYLRAPGRAAALQPFVVAVEQESGGASRAGAPLRYRAIERIPVAGGLFHLRNVIHVDQINDDAGQRFVKSVLRVEGPVSFCGALSLAGVNTMTLRPVEATRAAAGPEGAQQSTLVVDRFEFHRWPPLSRRFIEVTAKKARQAVLARLKAALETAADVCPDREQSAADPQIELGASGRDERALRPKPQFTRTEE
jgi:hypothetical protein